MLVYVDYRRFPCGTFLMVSSGFKFVFVPLNSITLRLKRSKQSYTLHFMTISKLSVGKHSLRRIRDQNSPIFGVIKIIYCIFEALYFYFIAYFE